MHLDLSSVGVSDWLFRDQMMGVKNSMIESFATRINKSRKVAKLSRHVTCDLFVAPLQHSYTSSVAVCPPNMVDDLIL